MNDQSKIEKVMKRIDEERGFYSHLLVYLTVNGFSNGVRYHVERPFMVVLPSPGMGDRIVLSLVTGFWTFLVSCKAVGKEKVRTTDE